MLIMGKKRIRSKKVSGGERRSVGRWVINAIRRDKSEFDKALDKLAAWKAGKNPWITIAGPSSNQRFIRVRANTLYGNPKTAMANIYGNKTEE
jgi:hypothetical protein